MTFIAIFTLIFLSVRLIVVSLNYFDKPFLPKSTLKTQEFISLLIPARNEATNLPKLFESLEKQTFLQYELLILNDNSDDATSTIVENYIKINPRCRLIDSKPLPEGWLGKNWACHQLFKQASGKYIFFLDADVVVAGTFFESVIVELKSKKLSFLSVFPDQIMITIGEKIIVPLMHQILLSLLRLKWVRTLPYPSMGAANGQCMVFEKEVYNQNLFHLKVKSCITEDIEIMQLAKKLKLKTAVYTGNGLISCRMYKDFNDALNGFSRSFISGFKNNIFIACMYVLPTTIFYFSLVYTDPKILTGAIIYVLASIIVIKFFISYVSGQNFFWNLLLHPFQLASLIVIFIRSLYLKISGKNEWKGRKI